MNIEAKTETQIPVEVVTRIEKIFVKEMVIKRGHSCFKFNTETGVLSKVTLEKKTVQTNVPSPKPKLPKGKGYAYMMEPHNPGNIRHQAKYDDNCIYFSALNFQSAMKRLEKLTGMDLGFKKVEGQS